MERNRYTYHKDDIELAGYHFGFYNRFLKIFGFYNRFLKNFDFYNRFSKISVFITDFRKFRFL